MPLAFSSKVPSLVDPSQSQPEGWVSQSWWAQPLPWPSSLWPLWPQRHLTGPCPHAHRTDPSHVSILAFWELRIQEGVMAMIPKVHAFLAYPTPLGTWGFWESQGACI